MNIMDFEKELENIKKSTTDKNIIDRIDFLLVFTKSEQLLFAYGVNSMRREIDLIRKLVGA